MKKKYVFKPYHQMFPELFQKEKERIASHVKGMLYIEHVGSTAIPGLGGKGIIDIAIAVDQNEMESVSKQLQSLGYEFRANFSTSERLYLVIDLPDPEEGNRWYHVHLTYFESGEWKELIDFRDYLKAHPKEVEEYAEIKRRAVLEANQAGELYRKIKEPMFKKIKSLVGESSKP